MRNGKVSLTCDPSDFAHRNVLAHHASDLRPHAVSHDVQQVQGYACVSHHPVQEAADELSNRQECVLGEQRQSGPVDGDDVHVQGRGEISCVDKRRLASSRLRRTDRWEWRLHATGRERKVHHCFSLLLNTPNFKNGEYDVRNEYYSWVRYNILQPKANYFLKCVINYSLNE